MVKVLIEVRSGAARFRVGVRAESIERAVSLVEKRLPNCSVEGSAARTLEPLLAA